jgi:hypothetical protein
MKARVMSKTNELLRLLNACQDETLVDDVCARVSCNDPFDDDEIEAAMAAETDEF